MAVHHITYATRNFTAAAAELAASAARFGLVTTVYTPASRVVRTLSRLHPKVMRGRPGAGYWLWKSFILRDALANARDGDIVIYTDAGMHVIADPLPILRLADQQPVVLFEHARTPDDPDYHQLRFWAKRDCFVLLDADEEQYWNAQTVLGGFQIYRACKASRQFVDEWLAACSNPRILTDEPNAMGHPNWDGFREHRHDQAALTILAVRHGVRTHIDPSQFGNLARRDEYGQIFDLHRRRTPSVLQALGQLIKPRTRLLRLMRVLFPAR